MEEVCQKEQPERFRVLVQQGRMPERNAQGKLIIRLEPEQNVWARLGGPRPLNKQPEHEASKLRLDGQATRELVRRLTEHRSRLPSSEQAESGPADGQRFRDPAEQQAHIDRLLRPRLPAQYAQPEDVNEGAARKPPSRSPLVRAGLSALAIESSDASQQSQAAAPETDSSGGGPGLVDSATTLEDLLGPLSWPGNTRISRSRAQQQEQMKRLAGPRPIPEAADSPVARVKKSAAQQREYSSHLSMPRQRPHSAREAESDAPEMLTEQQHHVGMQGDSTMPKRMQRACSVPSRPGMPYEVSSLPADLRLAIRRSMKHLRASRQHKLPNNSSNNACGPSEAALQQMLAMLDKMDGADAEQADSILASVRSLYANFGRESDCSTQLPDSELSQALHHEFSESTKCLGPRHGSDFALNRKGALAETHSQSVITVPNSCLEAEAENFTNQHTPTEVRGCMSKPPRPGSSGSLNQAEARRAPRRSSMSHWLPEDMIAQPLLKGAKE